MKYQNPIAKKGDFADPFVLKYNGIYYLYGTNPDIRCWSSPDLVHWKAEGATIEEGTFPGMVPFAPEVVYWNGYFYMYTSPSGFGHYVLQSKSPTGPFHKISGNVGHEIDGSILIDDDGTWYFYWAGDEGIWGCEMKSPVEFGEPVLTGAFMNGWTEGPLVYKKDGLYYMTYTGNHYLSKGYRINACFSYRPLSGYRDDRYNPVVVKAEGHITGLGHSSTVEGPDLISDYIIYHNMNEDTTRDLNIDRQLWYGEVTQIAGPTRMPQIAPALPDYAFAGVGKDELKFMIYRQNILHKKDRNDDGVWEAHGNAGTGAGGTAELPEGTLILSEQSFAGSFTAECNLRMPEGHTGGESAKAEILLVNTEKKDRMPEGRRSAVPERPDCAGEMSDDAFLGGIFDEYYGILFDRDKNAVYFMRRQGKKEETLVRSDLPKGYDFGALHRIKICRGKEGRLEVYIDSRLQFVSAVEKQTAYAVGCLAGCGGLETGYTAVTASVKREREEEAVFPVECGFYPVFGKTDGQRKADGSLFMEKGQRAQYAVYAGAGGVYRCAVTGNACMDGQTEVRIDGHRTGVCESSAGLSFMETELTEGIHSLLLVQKEGTAQIRRIDFRSLADCVDYGKELADGDAEPAGCKEHSAEGAKPAGCRERSAGDAEPAGCRERSAEGAEPAGCRERSVGDVEPVGCRERSAEVVELAGYGKRLVGSTWMADYAVTAALSVQCGTAGSAGILFRVTEPSEGGEGADTVLGADFFIGYSVSLTGEEIVLARHRYNEHILQKCSFVTKAGETHRIRAEVSGAAIAVYVDGKKAPVLSVTDDTPIESGCAGIRVKNGRINVRTFAIETI